MKKRVSSRIEKWKLLLGILFWGALAVECFALATGRLQVYGVARAALLPLLIVRVVGKGYSSKLGPFAYWFLLTAMAADLMTLYGNGMTVGYVGLSCFTASYLSMVCFVIKLYRQFDARYFVFFGGLSLFGMIDGVWLRMPESRPYIFFVQMGLHITVVATLLVSVFFAVKKLPKHNYPLLFAVGSGLVVVANLILALTFFRYRAAQPVLNALVGLCHGLYMYFFVKGLLRVVKR